MAVGVIFDLNADRVLEHLMLMQHTDRMAIGVPCLDDEGLFADPHAHTPLFLVADGLVVGMRVQAVDRALRPESLEDDEVGRCHQDLHAVDAVLVPRVLWDECQRVALGTRHEELPDILRVHESHGGCDRNRFTQSFHLLGRLGDFYGSTDGRL